MNTFTTITEVPRGRVKKVVLREEKPYGFIDLGENRDVYFNIVGARSLKVTPQGIVWITIGNPSMPEQGDELSFIVRVSEHGLKALYWTRALEYDIALSEFTSPLYRLIFVGIPGDGETSYEMWRGTNLSDPLLGSYWNPNQKVEKTDIGSNGSSPLEKYFERYLNGEWNRVKDPRPAFVYV